LSVYGVYPRPLFSESMGRAAEGLAGERLKTVQSKQQNSCKRHI
jgi:hypothetical protein